MLKSFHTVHRVLLTGTPLQVRLPVALRRCPCTHREIHARRDNRHCQSNSLCTDEHRRPSVGGPAAGNRSLIRPAMLFELFQTCCHSIHITSTARYALQNNLAELFMLMHFLDAAKFGSLEEFQEEYADLGEAKQARLACAAGALLPHQPQRSRGLDSHPCMNGEKRCSRWWVRARSLRLARLNSLPAHSPNRQCSEPGTWTVLHPALW